MHDSLPPFLFPVIGRRSHVRVAFDGEFERLPPSGIGGYLRNLVSNLPSVAPDLDLAVLHPNWDHAAPPEAGLLRDRRLQRASWELFGFADKSRRYRPDLMHIPSFAAPFRPPAPFVVTIHDMIPFLIPEYRASRPMRLHMALMKQTVTKASLIIAPSHSAASEICSLLNVERERIRVTHEAADATYVPIADPTVNRSTLARFGITGRYIFNVGGLDIRKNVATLIESFALVRAQSVEPIQLVIAGSRHSDNPVVFPDPMPVVERFGLHNAVIFTGRVNERDKLGLYQSADLYVTPSLHEGFGLTALEAMACGVPTIAANRTSFPEVVGDGGLLIEPEAGALAKAMMTVLTDDALAADLRARGVARAAQFSWRRTAEQTVEIYREVLSRNRRS